MGVRNLPLNMPVEVINFEPVNPMISKATVKIFYTGKNRNNSFISKEVAEKMIKTLPNIPIVGQYNSGTKDFLGHGHDFTEDENGNIIPSKKTIPYGVVPADTKIWWEAFTDESGQEREYLCSYCYLWTGRYPEARRIIETGRNNQSMELDPNTIQGEWTKLDKSGPEYFVIKEAVFSALCILGEDNEPCFEGAKFDPIIYALQKEKPSIDVEIQNLLFELDVALSDYKKEEITNFPSKGENKEISLRNSQWKLFDPAFAAKIKKEHPEIWRLGGNIRGNSQYRKLSGALGKKGESLSRAEKDAIKLREAWIARHYEDHLIAGVIAQIKWLAVGSRGESYMKKLVREEIKKREKRKKNMNHSLYSNASDLADKMLASIKKLDALADKFEEQQDAESTDMLDSIIEELNTILDSMSREDAPIQSDPDLTSLESYKKKEEVNLKGIDKLKASYEDEEMKKAQMEEEEMKKSQMEDEVGDPAVQMEDEDEMKKSQMEDEDEEETEEIKKSSMEDEAAANPEDTKVAAIIKQMEDLIKNLKKAQGTDEASESAYEDEDEDAKAEMIGKHIVKADEPIEDTAKPTGSGRKHPKSNPPQPMAESEDIYEKYGNLVMENEDLKMQLEEMKQYKAKIEMEEKESMIEKFSALDPQFLSNIKKKLQQYSLEQLEAKLSIEAVRSGVRIKSDSRLATYSLESDNSDIPGWVAAIEKTKK